MTILCFLIIHLKFSNIFTFMGKFPHKNWQANLGVSVQRWHQLNLISKVCTIAF